MSAVFESIAPAPRIADADYKSAKRSLPSIGTTISFAHGLSAVPRLVMVAFRFKRARSPYALGDEMQVMATGFQQLNNTPAGVEIISNAMMVSVRLGQNAPVVATTSRRVLVRPGRSGGRDGEARPAVYRTDYSYTQMAEVEMQVKAWI